MGKPPLQLVDPSRRRPSGISFVDDLARHGASPALLLPDGSSVTYEALAGDVADVRDRLGGHRRLVLVEAANERATVTAYLAALAGRHPVALVTAGSAAVDAVTQRFAPDVVVGVDGTIVEHRSRAAHPLHPDLALLLSTSGSSGSPKLVRLSADNLQANAAAIATYLELGPEDRAVTSLPLGYCYGLSVLHTHLLVGAGVALSSASVVDPCFWELFRRVGATSLAGVPHTFDLLERMEFASMDLPTLRTVTQAGGRLDPNAVRRWAALGREQGWKLFVMYGQTEATARMAYLPPELAEARSTAIGRPIPGGAFELAPVDGVPPGVGELVYRGANVMLGYATDASDLGLGRVVHELRTGDLARRAPDGLFEICGRRSRFVKLYGLRVDLDQVEAIAASLGHRALSAGDDTGIVVAVTEPEVTVELARGLSHRLGLPRSAVRVVAVDELPLLPNGKPDHRAVRALTSDSPEVAPSAPHLGGTGHGCRHPVDRLLAEVLGVDVVADDDTFVGLGGDSLSYVEASIGLERILGRAPDGWHHRTVAELRSLRPTGSARRIEVTVAARAIAIVGVVAAHAGLLPSSGSAHVLLAVAGMNAARFTLGGSLTGRTVRGLHQVARVALPTVAYLAAFALVVDGIAPTTVALGSAYAGEGTWRYRYWFVEVLAQLLVVVVAAMAVRPVARLERRYPFAVALGALAVALSVRDLELGAPGWDELKVHAVAWIFVLGWAAERARRPWEQVVVTSAVVFAVPGFFATATRDALVVVGLLVLVWVTDVPVSRRLHEALGLVAGASLVIYLTHWQVLEALDGLVPAPVAAMVAVSAGVAARAGWRRLGSPRSTINRSAIGAGGDGERRGATPPSTLPLVDLPR